MSDKWVMVPKEPTDEMLRVMWRWHGTAAMYKATIDAAPAAPQQAEPVAQIGWADEFGNLFPMAAWKPAQRTHHDSHKTAWRPVFLHPPAAEVQRLRDAARAVLQEYSAHGGLRPSSMNPLIIDLHRAMEGKQC